MLFYFCYCQKGALYSKNINTNRQPQLYQIVDANRKRESCHVIHKRVYFFRTEGCKDSEGSRRWFSAVRSSTHSEGCSELEDKDELPGSTVRLIVTLSLDRAVFFSFC